MKYLNYSYWSNRITNFVFKTLEIKDGEELPQLIGKLLKLLPGKIEVNKESAEYGAYMQLSEFSKIFIVLVTARILNVIWYVQAIILLFGILRWCLGGIHAKTHWACLLSYIIFIYGILGISVFLTDSRLVLDFLIIPITFIIAYKYAPADMPVKPIVSKKQRKRLRITGFILLSILFIMAQFLGQVWFNIIMLTIALAVVLMTPPIYKLTRNKYGKEETV